MRPPPPPLLQLDRATVLRGGRRALDDLSLTLRVGEHTAVLGPNGSGKSTLVQLLTGRLYPVARPDGDPPIRVLGRERWNLEELRSHIGVVSADLHQRFVGGSSLGHVRAIDAVIASFFASEVVFAHHRVTREMREAAAEALDRVGAGHLVGSRLHHVSTGEARRVLLARALVHRPDVLLLDEPTTGLDAAARHAFLTDLRALAARGCTLIFITHHLEEVIPEIERVILLARGRVSADGTPGTVLTSERISAAYGAPLRVGRDAGGHFRIEVGPRAGREPPIHPSPTTMNGTDPRFPIGRPDRASRLEAGRRADLIRELEALPGQLRAAVGDLAPHEWDLAYRDGGWTVRQVVHHLADSHLNAYVRVRLAATEDVPTLKPYDEAAWAELPDVATVPPEVSIQIVEGLHRRLVALLRGLRDEDFARAVHHPEQDRRLTIDELLTIYSWHGRHHVAHILQARERGRLAGTPGDGGHP